MLTLSTHTPLWQSLINGLRTLPPSVISADQNQKLLSSLETCGGDLRRLSSDIRRSLYDLFERGHVPTKHWGRGPAGAARFASVRDLIKKAAALTGAEIRMDDFKTRYLGGPIDSFQIMRWTESSVAEAIAQVCKLHPELNTRPYQREGFEGIAHAVSEFLTEQTNAGDRGFVVMAPQTGKTSLIPAVSDLALQLQPEKQILVLSPRRVITRDMRADAEKWLKNGRVSVFDMNDKDLRGELVIASIYTLHRYIGEEDFEKKLPAHRVSLLVIDEMYHLFASMWQEVLRYLGVVNDLGEPMRQSRVFVLGLGASTRRRDQRQVEEFFGDTCLVKKDIGWFLDSPYYHKICGLELTYGLSSGGSEKIESVDESVVAMRDTPQNRYLILETYENNFKGKRVVVWVNRIDHATHLAEDFNELYGNNFAYAVVSDDRSETEVATVIDRFNQNTGPKVIISISKLAYGARLEAEGVIHTQITDSEDLYKQRSCRPLAKSPYTPSKEVLIVTFIPQGMDPDQVLTAANLIASRVQLIRGHRYTKQDVDEAVNNPPLPPATNSNDSPKTLLQIKQERKIRLKATRSFSDLWYDYLKKYFGGDLLQMARTLRPKSGNLKRDVVDCEALLYGDIPASYDELVRKWIDPLERHGVRCLQPLTQAWLKDQIHRLDTLRPVTASSPAHEKLVHLFRQAVLLRSVISISSDVTKHLIPDFSIWNPDITDTVFSYWLRGIQWPTTASKLDCIRYLIFETGLADDEKIRSLMSFYLKERLHALTREANEVYMYQDADLPLSRRDQLVWPDHLRETPEERLSREQESAKLREALQYHELEPNFLKDVQRLFETGEFQTGIELALDIGRSRTTVSNLRERNFKALRLYFSAQNERVDKAREDYRGGLIQALQARLKGYRVVSSARARIESGSLRSPFSPPASYPYQVSTVTADQVDYKHWSLLLRVANIMPSLYGKKWKISPASSDRLRSALTHIFQSVIEKSLEEEFQIDFTSYNGSSIKYQIDECFKFTQPFPTDQFNDTIKVLRSLASFEFMTCYKAHRFEANGTIRLPLSVFLAQEIEKLIHQIVVIRTTEKVFETSQMPWTGLTPLPPKLLSEVFSFPE